MKRLLLLGGFTLAGILIAGGVSFLINLAVFSGTEYDPVLVWGFIIIPSSLFIGSCFTGYLSQPYQETNLRRSLLIAPGFYGAALLVVQGLVFLIMRPEYFNVGSASGALFYLLVAISWISSSEVGILFGMKFRARKQYMPPSQWPQN